MCIMFYINCTLFIRLCKITQKPMIVQANKYFFSVNNSLKSLTLHSKSKIMARKKKPLPIFTEVTITDIAAEGKSLARIMIPEHDGTPESKLIVFVPFCVPGDVVDLQVTRKKHSYAEAKVIKFHKLSEKRTTPPCKHFGVCGGCKWQNLPYEEQLKAKQKQVFDQLTRIGHLNLPEPGTTDEHTGIVFHPIMGSVKQYEYRNKLDFGYSNKKWLTEEEVRSGETFDNMNACGFHITGAFDKIYPIEKCWLMDDFHNRLRNGIYDYAIKNGLTFFDLRAQNGLLRDLIIRNSNSGEWMVIMQFHFDEPEDEKRALALLQYITDNYKEVSTLMYVDNQKCNDTIYDQDIKVFKGDGFIFEHMEDLRFKVGPKSFYQTNTEQAYHLYSVVRQMAFKNMPFSTEEEAVLEGKATRLDEQNETNYSQKSSISSANLPVVYDLYTGTGTIANFVAKQSARVIGIEYVPEAIEDAKVNSEVNGIDNTLFFAGDMKDVLTDEFIAEHGQPDIIITDPPRAGMHKDVVGVILNARPRRIVYVSCNPATQARDLELLCEQYKIAEVQPVDMFPHTPHVENVVLLELNSDR